ncbi:MAG TPA: hypothetical protein VET26_03960 [Candidatus Sulfotelmatobacter sp.]|nr:hypothetical protein [Candidatus Sulfotelmatobacter sp.]
MLVAERLTVSAPPRLSLRLGLPSEGQAVFGLSAGSYLALALVLALRFHVVTAQALGLVANAAYVALSRDPHLAAIGFVGSPLPSIAVLPLLPLRALWPALTETGLAACIVSALFMAGAVYQLHQCLLEARVPRAPRLGLTVLFALHPLVLYSAALGMQEAAYLFFLLLAVRHLARWLRTKDAMGEVVAGFALAGAYLSRYDAALAGVAVVLAVAVISGVRSREHRLATAACDAAIVGGPLLGAVALWAAAAWLVTGNAFPQVSSTYGYLPQLDALRAHGAPLATPARTLLQVLSIEPALPAVVLLLAWTILRRNPGALAAVVFGPLAIAIGVAGLLGWAFPWLRLFIVLVPLTTLALALPLAESGAGRAARPDRPRWPFALAACLMLAAALPTTVSAMLNPATGQEEAPVLTAIRTQGVSSSRTLASATDAARYLDDRHLGQGTVLLDSFTGFPIMLASSSPRQFLITSDREFAVALRSPVAFGVRYILVPAPGYLNGLGSLDAVNHAYPDLYPAGAASGELVREFTGPGKHVEWRLYRVAAVQPSA